MAASPTLDAIRERIRTLIKSALNSGSPASVDNVVHPYRRFWRDEDKFRQLFKRTDAGAFLGLINGWMVTRMRTREEETEERWRFYQIHRFELMGYMGIQDGTTVKTEKDFQDQIELIRDNLRLDIGAGSVFGNTERTVPVTQVEQVIPVTIGDSTCWHALLSLEAEGIETKTLTP